MYIIFILLYIYNEEKLNSNASYQIPVTLKTEAEKSIPAGFYTLTGSCGRIMIVKE